MKMIGSVRRHSEVVRGQGKLLMVPAAGNDAAKLRAIKLAHTAIWAIMAGCILLLPVVGMERNFVLAAVLTGVVLAECGVLAVNRCKCPLTVLAARYTGDRTDSFDIYLPLWLARHNKTVFGTLFVVGEIVVLWCWLR